MALNFERGINALKSSGGGGEFRPFVPFIRWAEDNEEKYVVIPNPVDVIPKIHVHEFVQVGEGERVDGSKFPKYEEFLDRTTPAIGDDSDPLTEKGSDSRERNLAVGVELEPRMAPGRNGRIRPQGFEVKTVEFQRRVLDDNGEDTGEKEEVVAPVIGLISQSPYNFFGYLGSYNETDGPHEDIAFRIKRRGSKQNTAYDWTPYEDQEIDWSNVIDYVDGISYLRNEMDDIKDAIDGLDPVEAVQHIANAMLEKRLQELADWDRYQKLTDSIDEIVPKFGKKKGKERKERPARKTQQTRKSDESSDDSNDDASDELEEFERLKAKANRSKAAA